MDIPRKIGYKATYNYKCRDQVYEVGQEYKIDEKPIICKKGFHYCMNAVSTLDYYPIKPDFKLLEIENLSKMFKNLAINSVLIILKLLEKLQNQMN